MSHPDFRPQRSHRGTGESLRRCLLALLLLPGLGLAGCERTKTQQLDQKCGPDYAPCAKGLRCSFDKKRCYQPVDCQRLEQRLKACLGDLVTAYAPRSAKLEPAKRVRLLDKLSVHLKTEVFDHCRYDAATYKKKHKKEPSDKRSYGEDPRVKDLAGCLAKQGCKPFVRCLLKQGRLLGTKRPDPKGPAVFPIRPPRPKPTMAPADADPMKAGTPPGKDAKPGKDALPAKPGKDAQTAKAMTPARPTMPAPPKARTRPTPRPR